jgi:hypothetical protein
METTEIVLALDFLAICFAVRHYIVSKARHYTFEKAVSNAQ